MDVDAKGEFEVGAPPKTDFEAVALVPPNGEGAKDEFVGGNGAAPNGACEYGWP